LGAQDRQRARQAAEEPAAESQMRAAGDRSLADAIRRPGLDIFQTFNEVGLAVKRATGGSQQPWVTVTGAAQLVEFVEIVKEEIRVVAKESPKSGILANEDPAYLLSLGIPESYLQLVRDVDDDGLLDLLPRLPEEAQESLMALATGERPASSG
jgi:hypothetical protein